MAGAVESSFDTLKSGYEDFMVPSSEILADGGQVSGSLGLYVQKLQVFLSSKRPSTVKFTVNNSYDISTHSLTDSAKEGLLPGGKLQVKLGYGSKRKSLFTGYIDRVSMRYVKEEAYILDVYGADVRKLMQESGRRRLLYDVDSLSEAFEQVMKGYKGYCSAKADAMEGKLSYAVFQDCTDYEFVTDVLLKGEGAGREFLVDDGEALYRKYEAPSKAVTELKPGEGLQSFTVDLSYVNRKITAYGYSVREGQFKGTATAEGKYKSSSAAALEESLYGWKADTQERADRMADGYAAGLERSARSGKLYALGLPELVPGKTIAVAGMDGRMNGTYYITEALHTIGEDGYETVLSVIG